MPVEEFIVSYVQWLLPTWFLRLGVRLYLKYKGGPAIRTADVVCKQIQVDRFERCKEPVTTMVEEANEQHYGNDPAFFLAHLGPKLKYSSCEWPGAGCTLAEAEDATILIYQDKAGLASLPKGSKVLELGCGWGSLTLANAARFPELNFTAFSNSPQQIEFITNRAKERGLTNVTLCVEDYADFVVAAKSKVGKGALFDCAMAIETIEHCRNIGLLLEAVGARLKPGATLFVQSLLHQSASYLVDSGDWMGRNFFSGGSIMSLNSYYHLCPPSLRLDEVQPLLGDGYSKTLSAWCDNLEVHQPSARTLFLAPPRRSSASCAPRGPRSAPAHARSCAGLGRIAGAAQAVRRQVRPSVLRGLPRLLLRVRRGLRCQQRRRVHGRLLHVHGGQGHQGGVSLWWYGVILSR